MEQKASDIAATLADMAEIRLREDIVGGRLEPTRRLRLEELKARYDIGVSPLREALSRLIGAGLVEVEGNKGFRVRGLSREDLDDIAAMRSAIEVYAVRLAVERGDDAWEAGILAALHRLVRATERFCADRTTLDAWTETHDAFHRALIAACGSPRMLAQQHLLAGQHTRYRLVLMAQNIPYDLLIREHRDLADLVLARDADAAARRLAQHMRITSDFYAEALDRKS